MKALKLTKEHKEKLLEMCNKLFPEYIITFNINALEYGTFMVTNNGETIIHWFEFCMTHLQEKILKWGAEELGSEAIDGNIHLVDYLYKEFKKLEN